MTTWLDQAKRLREVYTSDGVLIWMSARNRRLGDRRPVDIWGTEEGQAAVIAEVDRLLGDGNGT